MLQSENKKNVKDKIGKNILGRNEHKEFIKYVHQELARE
jgi:hypothetical protein